MLNRCDIAVTTAADVIVASVQANPPGGDVAVSPAVRVLVEEIVRLQGMLKHFGELSEADHNRLRVRGDGAIASVAAISDLYRWADGTMKTCDTAPTTRCVRTGCRKNGCDRANAILKATGLL